MSICYVKGALLILNRNHCKNFGRKGLSFHNSYTSGSIGTGTFLRHKDSNDLLREAWYSVLISDNFADKLGLSMVLKMLESDIWLNLAGLCRLVCPIWLLVITVSISGGGSINSA